MEENTPAVQASDNDELWGPHSQMWRINRETILIAGGARALLLQLAHPAVAAGVDQHSNFKAERYKRLFRTLWLMNQIIYGREATRLKAARTINRRHQAVQGAVESSGAAYRANDPALGWWVLATLIDSSLMGYERWVQPLTDAEHDQYYEECKALAAVFGIQPKHMPSDYPAYRAWFDDTLTNGTLAYDDVNRRLANEIFALPWPLGQLAYGLTMMVTPAPVREGFGFAWSAAQAAPWRRFEAGLSAWYRRMPGPLRYNKLVWLVRML